MNFAGVLVQNYLTVCTAQGAGLDVDSDNYVLDNQPST